MPRMLIIICSFVVVQIYFMLMITIDVAFCRNAWSQHISKALTDIEHTRTQGRTHTTEQKHCNNILTVQKEAISTGVRAQPYSWRTSPIQMLGPTPVSHFMSAHERGRLGFNSMPEDFTENGGKEQILHEEEWENGQSESGYSGHSLQQWMERPHDGNIEQTQDYLSNSQYKAADFSTLQNHKNPLASFTRLREM